VVPSATNSSPTDVDWLYISDDPPVDASFTLGVGPHSVDNRVNFEPIHVTPFQFQSRYDDKKKIRGTSVVFYEYNSENFGHMLMDVLLPIYSVLDGFNLLERRDVQLFRYSIPDPICFSCDCQIDKAENGNQHERHQFGNAPKFCARFYSQLVEMFHGDPNKQVQVLNATDMINSKTPICFEELVVGMPQYSDDCLEGSHGKDQNIWSLCNHGRQSQFWRFREFIFQNLGLSNTPPQSHKITITQRGGGMMTRDINNIDELVSSLQTKFENSEVNVVEWHKLTIRQQLELAASTTVLITPPGGVSYISIFLPRWATGIRLYPQDFRNDWHIMHYLGYITNEHVKTPGGEIPINDVVAMVDKGMKRYDAFATTS
jgi:hypothetical protein